VAERVQFLGPRKGAPAGPAGPTAGEDEGEIPRAPAEDDVPF